MLLLTLEVIVVPDAQVMLVGTVTPPIVTTPEVAVIVESLNAPAQSMYMPPVDDETEVTELLVMPASDTFMGVPTVPMAPAARRAMILPATSLESVSTVPVFWVMLEGCVVVPT